MEPSEQADWALLRRTTISIAQPPSKELTTRPPLSDSSHAPRPLRPSDHCSFASGAGVPRIRMSLVHLGDRSSARIGGRCRSLPPWDRHRGPVRTTASITALARRLQAPNARLWRIRGLLGSPGRESCLRAGAGICRPRRVRGSLCPVGERALLGPAPTSWPHVVWGRHDVGAGPDDERLERAAIGVRLVGQSGNSAGCTSRPLVGLVRRRGALHGSVLRRGRSRRTRRGPQSPRRA